MCELEKIMPSSGRLGWRTRILEKPLEMLAYRIGEEGPNKKAPSEYATFM